MACTAVRFSSLSLLCWLLALLLWAPPGHANGILTASDPGRGGPTGRRGGEASVFLAAHEVDVRLRDRVADVTVEQVFRNRTKRELEGNYLFPLPEGAVVSRFAMTMGGKMVKGEVLEAQEARAIYHGIVRRRRDPGLLEYVGRGLFRARVFPIPPEGEVKVRIGFQQVLPEDRGVLELRYPLASDRFSTRPVATTRLRVDVRSSVDVKGVYSPSHDFSIQRDGERRVRARLLQRNRRQTRDLLLYVARSPDEVGCTVLSNKRAGEDGTFLAIVAPRAEVPESERVPKDILFVLDTSGSMRGEKLEQARAALRQGVSILREGDRFNLISFSSMARPFRDTPVPIGEDTRKSADTWIGRLQADGGTNIGQALAMALEQTTSERLGLVVLITDGRPTLGHKSADGIVDMVDRANRGRARVFTFGVGYDLDVALLDRVAEATRGARDYIAPGENIEIVTSRFFRKVERPAVTDVRLELGSGITDVYPQALPDLFAGEQLVVYGRYRDAGPRTLTLRGRIGAREIVREHMVQFSEAETADFLPRLWANRKVAYLLDHIRLHGPEQELVDEVVRLAKLHSIVTPYTAGLVVEESELSGVRSENPLFQIGGRRLSAPSTGGHGGHYRGPAGSVPPSQREPSDPTPGPPPPPSGPPTTPPPSTPTPTTPASGPTMGAPGGPLAPTPPPATPTTTSKDLQKRKKADRHDAADERPGRVVSVAGKTFVLRKDGRWVDAAWDEKGETVKVELLSEAYFALLEKDKRVARYLAVGKRVVVVLAGTAYEVVLPKKEGR